MADDVTSDSEDEMPPGWEERVTVGGQVFFVCHQTQKTQWTHPVTGKRKKITGDLPFGWERKIGDTGYVYYIDHINKRTTFTDPRLAFAVEDYDAVGDVSALRQKFDANSTAMHVLAGRDLSGKYAIVTGANTGLGYETARSLALFGCTVVMACRDLLSANECIKKVTDELPEAKLIAMHIDLSSLSSVKQFAKEYRKKSWPLHMLILNAGVFSPPYTVTEDNLEMAFQVNCLSHFYLCRLLEDTLKTSAPSRVVHVASDSHRYPGLNSADDLSLDTVSPDESSYRPMVHYGLTKLLNVTLSKALNHRQAVNKVFHNSLHPGNLINTSLSRHWWGYRLLFKILQPFTKTLQQGAATTVYVATALELEDVGGMYFNNCWVCEPSKLANDQQLCEKSYELLSNILMSKMGENAYCVD